MSGIKRFFPADKQQPRKSPQKPPIETAKSSGGTRQTGTRKKVDPEVLELLDSSDDDVSIVDVKHENSSQPSTKPSNSSANNNSKPAGAAPPAKPKSAAEVLASIPSAELPNVEPGAKPNFRQAMERKSAAESSSSDAVPDIEAAPNCLMGLTFVVTGQLPTLGREEIQNLIKRYGGHVTSSLSGKTSCLVMGEDAGPSKIQKAKSLKLKVIDEAGFIQLLQSMPADGGSGEAAEKARLKRQREAEQIKEEAKRFKMETAAASPQRGSGTKRKAPIDDEKSNVMAVEKELWTTKYAPHKMSDMIGNNAALQRLSKWLENWRAARQGKWKGEGSEFRAAMISGPPGIGKSTAAHLVGELQGYDIVEYNASDTRSKSLLQAGVARTLNNSTLGLPTKEDPRAHHQYTRKLMVVMDEVDGMSAGDRGGVGAMAALARTTNVPLILVCNERSLPKMKPFDRTVFELPFRRPDASQVRHRLMAIAHAEGLDLDPNSVEQLVAATRSDIRQMLNLLETYRTTKSSMSYDGSRQFSKSWNKELVLKPFDIAGRLLSRGSQKSMSTSERMELYFHDYDFAPLMIQENYLHTAPNLAAASAAANSISDGDLVDRQIHGQQQQWSLMPLHALLSCVRPAYAAAGDSRGRFGFTSYLGNNSKAMKYRRLLAELRSHMRLKTSTSSVDLRLEYQPLLAYLLLSPLLERGSDAIPQVIEFMDNYYLTKEDWDVVMELGVGVNKNNTEAMAKKLPTAVKTAFTRKYNAASHPLPFMRSMDSKSAAATGRKREVPDIDDVIQDDTEDVEPKDEGNGDEGENLETAVKNDKYIKAKAKPKAKAAPKAKAKPRAAPKRKAK